MKIKHQKPNLSNKKKHTASHFTHPDFTLLLRVGINLDLSMFAMLIDLGHNHLIKIILKNTHSKIVKKSNSLMEDTCLLLSREPVDLLRNSLFRYSNSLLDLMYSLKDQLIKLKASPGIKMTIIFVAATSLDLYLFIGSRMRPESMIKLLILI